MGQRQRIRNAAPALYQGARRAVRALQEDDPTKALQALQAALQEAEDPARWARVKLTTTNRTADLVLKFAEEQRPTAPVFRRLHHALVTGLRRTRMRAFFEFEAERDLIQAFRAIIKDKYSGSSRRAFERIDQELRAYDKSPLLLLAETAS